MKASDLREELGMKTREFEQALEQGTPRHVLMDLYKQLKELQFQLTMAEISDPASHSKESPRIV